MVPARARHLTGRSNASAARASTPSGAVEEAGYKVKIVTGDLRGAGSDAQVSVLPLTRDTFGWKSRVAGRGAAGSVGSAVP
jgi:hypothetical protein